MPKTSSLLGSFAVAAVVLQTACTTPGGGGPAPLAVNPTCTILGVSSLQNNTVDTPSSSTYMPTDPTAVGGFTLFRTISGPRGNPPVAGNPDAYGISEAWFRRPGNATVVRAQSHGAPRQGATDNLASAWSVHAEDNTGTWGPIFGRGSANPGNEQDDSARGALTTPQLMTVGSSNLQMFACVGGRTEDNTGRTTWLVEILPPNVASGFTGGGSFIQDVLYGDDHFLPNAPGPIIGPSNPPTPNVHGPGDQAQNGHAQCAMVQQGDDVTSRELHMIVVANGHLLHSIATGFGPARDASGFVVVNRFSMISQWEDMSSTLGVNFGNVESATIVASRPTAISIMFEADNSGRHRVWHAVKLSSNPSWRPVDDVTMGSGASLNGLVDSWNVAAGVCPSPDGPTAPDELQYITWNNNGTFFGRVVSAPRQWAPSLTGIYSPLVKIPSILVFPNDPNRHNVAQTVQLITRPFP
jgi:hypothetical protein